MKTTIRLNPCLGGTLAAIILSCLGANDAIAQESGAGRRPLNVAQALGYGDGAAPAKAPKPQLPTWSQMFGLDGIPAPDFHLGPIDPAALIAEDQQRVEQFGSGPLRVSIGRDISYALVNGQWQQVLGGNLWRGDISLEGAYAVRLHFFGFNLPQGAEVVVYSLDQPGYPPSRFDGLGPLGNSEFWTPNFPGSKVRIEYYLPADLAPDGNALPFVIDQVQHAYRDLFRLDNDGGIAAAGSCNLIPACYPAWTNMRKAIGRVSFTSGGSGFLCSGTLIATQNNDQTPYYLTANHCISTDPEANSAEVFWKYESTQCNPPNPAFGPTSTFCSLVATYAGSDETLLMVEGALPTDMFWAGWTSAAQPTNLMSTCLHHPSGDYMRISFCTQFNNANCSSGGGPLSNWCRADWCTNCGVTEPGSSGSGLFRNDTQQLYATLTCGSSSCANPAGDDSYGRFAPAYNAMFAGPLISGSDDVLEQNDTCATAAPVTPGTYNNLIVKSTDEDWYRINIVGGSGINVTLSFTHVNGDIDMQLYNSCGGSIVAQSVSNTNTESFNYTNTGATADFFLRVYLDSDTRNTYNMTITPLAPSNNNCANAIITPVGSYPFSTVAATTDGPTETLCNTNGSNQITNDIWYFFPAQCTGTATVSLCGSSFDSRVAAYNSACPSGSGTAVACNDNFCGDDGQVSFPVTNGQIYRIRVGGFNGATGSGTMVITCTPAPPTGACCLPNGLCQGNDTQAFCQSQGGTYQGNNSTCGSVSCPQPTGACCLPSGSCLGNITLANCQAQSGTYQGNNTSCGSVNCPQPTGACCLPNGTCQGNITQANCQSQSGTYQGDNSSCGSVNCPQPTGACCLPNGSCQGNITQATCQGLSGTYQGNNSSCGSVNCPQPTGACCLPNGSCQGSITQASCQGLSGTYKGNNSSCGSVNCPQPTGACCLPNGTCQGNITQANCLLQSGTYQGDNSSCGSVNCPQPTGACCLPSGTCSGDITEAACVAQSGTYQGDNSTCAATKCPQPTGACCLPSGSCLENVTLGNCKSKGGSYQGDSTSCASANCPQRTGACCLLNGTCQSDITQADCQSQNGTYQGDNSTCASANCPQPTGACCLNNGTCSSNVTQADCQSQNGTYQGDNSSCASANCPQPTGACCLPNGSCAGKTTLADCLSQNGNYQGDNSSCASANCPQPTGACCLPNGSCADRTTLTDCLLQNGNYQGDNSSCASANCQQPTGACCLPNGSCTGGTTQSDCQSQSGTYQGDNSACGSVSCPQPTGACCMPDGSCLANITQANCRSQSGIYQGDNATCASANCPQPIGACCLPNGSCLTDVTQADCQSQNGAYQGDNTSCSSANCPQPIGACCLANGSCLEHITQTECGKQNGSYQGDNSSCASANCPQPTGACCLSNGTCQGNVTQAGCLSSGGSYQGDNVLCANVSCPHPCPADIDGNHTVNTADLLGVINGWGACPLPCPPYCASDINHDCVTNSGDLLAVINAWGPCP